MAPFETELEHGTQARYQWHMRNKVSACAACTAAHHKYKISVQKRGTAYYKNKKKEGKK